MGRRQGGGHAFLGLHLARRLLKDGHAVSILNDGDEVITMLPTVFAFQSSASSPETVRFRATAAGSSSVDYGVEDD